MKITFELSPDTVTELQGLLAPLEIPMTALADIAREHLESFQASDDAFLVEGFTYPDRSTAQRAAAHMLKKYHGSSEMMLTYEQDGDEVSEDFYARKVPPPLPFPLAVGDCFVFTTHLPREHVNKVTELLQVLEIPVEQMMGTFRGTLESEVWRDDPLNWTTGYVYPDRETAERVAKRVLMKFPGVHGFLDLAFLEEGQRVTVNFPARRGRSM